MAHVGMWRERHGIQVVRSQADYQDVVRGAPEFGIEFKEWFFQLEVVEILAATLAGAARLQSLANLFPVVPFPGLHNGCQPGNQPAFELQPNDDLIDILTLQARPLFNIGHIKTEGRQPQLQGNPGRPASPARRRHGWRQ